LPLRLGLGPFVWFLGFAACNLTFNIPHASAGDQRLVRLPHSWAESGCVPESGMSPLAFTCGWVLGSEDHCKEFFLHP